MMESRRTISADFLSRQKTPTSASRGSRLFLLLRRDFIFAFIDQLLHSGFDLIEFMRVSFVDRSGCGFAELIFFFLVHTYTRAAHTTTVKRLQQFRALHRPVRRNPGPELTISSSMVIGPVHNKKGPAQKGQPSLFGSLQKLSYVLFVFLVPLPTRIPLLSRYVLLSRPVALLLLFTTPLLFPLLFCLTLRILSRPVLFVCHYLALQDLNERDSDVFHARGVGRSEYKTNVTQKPKNRRPKSGHTAKFKKFIPQSPVKSKAVSDVNRGTTMGGVPLAQIYPLPWSRV